MSGSGGFYKYRCKNFYTYNCQNWVWVNNAACAHCLADGRDEEPHPGVIVPHSSRNRDVVVPKIRGGILQNTMMELVAPTEPGEKVWTLRDKDVQPPPALPVTSGMSSQANLAPSRLEISKTKDEDF